MSRTFTLANLAWQLPNQRDLIRDAAEDADVLAFVECRTRANTPVDVSAVLGVVGWHTVQFGIAAGHPARAGVALAVRRGVGLQIVSPRLRAGSPPARGVQARYILDAIVRDLEAPAKTPARRSRLAVSHSPISSTTVDDDWTRAMRQWRRAAAAARRRQENRHGHPTSRYAALVDANRTPFRFADEVGFPHVVGADVMAFAYSGGWGGADLDHDAEWLGRAAGTDHHVLSVTA